MNKIIVAIDGYSSCGKSTLAKQLASELKYVYVDTGAMYRAVTLFALRNNIINDNGFNIHLLITSLNNIDVSFNFNVKTNKAETYLNNENVEADIRGLEVSSQVSKIAQVKEVRDKMVEVQREMGRQKGLVMDGRDIGSVVFPNAELKLFMTAKPEIRAKRRFDELKAKGETISFEAVLENVELRDNDDTSRSENPLIQSKDAIVLDNSDISQHEQFEIALNLVKERL